MKLIQPETFTGVLEIKGVSFPPFGGIVDIPDDLVTDNLWGFGFVRLEEKPALKSKAIKDELKG